jgi:hypothetical protein
MLLAACGEAPTVDQASPRPPLQAAHVVVTRSGDGGVAIDPGGVVLRLDDARLLVVEVRVRSTSAGPQSIALRATATDASGQRVGEATGGAVNLAPGSESTVELSGPTPTGTIAAVAIEVHAVPAITAAGAP